MENRCIRCGSPAAFPIRALEVRTLHVRGLGGERRVQALGDKKTAGVCEACTRKQLNLSLDPVRAAKPQLVRFGAVFAAGLLVGTVTLLFVKESRQVFLLLGLAALICGVLGIYDALRKAKEKSASLAALPETEALEEAAWDIFTADAPKKDGINDLTYIPVNEKSLARKNGDLMILYHLLPEIAVRAWNILHNKGEENHDPPHCDVQDQG